MHDVYTELAGLHALVASLLIYTGATVFGTGARIAGLLWLGLGLLEIVKSIIVSQAGG